MQLGIFIVETGCKEKPQTKSDNPQTIPLFGNFEFIRNHQIFICPTKRFKSAMQKSTSAIVNSESCTRLQ